MNDEKNMYKIAQMLQRIGTLKKARKSLARRCRRKLKRIETIAIQEGLGTRLGTASSDYIMFLRCITPILSGLQVNNLSKEYMQIQQIWIK